METLFLFLTEEGVEPTNNFGERMLRFAVLWRKRSQGTKSEDGNRWVERILSLRQTCRLHSKASFDVLVDAFTCSFNTDFRDKFNRHMNITLGEPVSENRNGVEHRSARGFSEVIAARGLRVE